MSNPVAYRFQSPATEEWLLGLEPPVGSKWEVEPLYTAPPQRLPLTEEEISEFADKHLFYQPEGYEVSGIFNLARAIERARGVGGEE